MGLHKIRPRLKNYSKTKIFLKAEHQQNLTVSKKKNYFSPEVTYLSSKWINKLDKHFKNNLEERRKLKFFFGFYRTSLLKKIIKKEFSKKKKLKYSLNELEFCSLLERRLDVLLFRLGFVPSIFAAKQLISHKKVKVNNHANSSFSRLLKKGDIISFDSSVYLVIQNSLVNYWGTYGPSFHSSNQVEVNFKTLKLIVLMNKINIFSQLPQYRFLLKWNNIIEDC